MALTILATICAGLFAGGAVFVSFVEHPARLACGTTVAITEFAPSYKRASIMQATLASLGLLVAVGAWLLTLDGWLLFGGLVLGANIPFTLIVIMPTNHRLLSPSLDKSSMEAGELLQTWGRLHAVRTALGVVAFLIFVWRAGST